MTLDSFVSTAVFETFDGIRRGWLWYSSWLERFRIRGLKRFVVDLADDFVTFALIISFGILVYALPPFSGEGDIWNQRREFAVTFTDINGETIGRRGIRQDDAIPLEEIPQIVIKAALATEDARFYQHFGVDVQGVMRAMVANARAQGVVQGGSTITQQLAKNLFLSPERSLRRKVHEAFLALWIEARLSKNEILKLYLDRAYMGGGNYGVEAAAQFYFGKSIRDVNLSEAATLAGLFKAPSKYAPHINPEASRARSNVVLYRMLDVGYISQGELFEAKRHPPAVINQADYYSPNFFLDWSYREALEIVEEQGLEGDYVLEVKTTVNIGLQKKAQKIVTNMIDQNVDRFNVHQAALVSMRPDGAITVVVGGHDYEKSQFNRATDALRQPGSSFKPFVYMAALRKGYTPRTIVYDKPVRIGSWSPKNYGRRYRGRTDLTTALAKSINTIPVHIMKDIGRKVIVETTKLAGLQSEIKPVASMPLGTNEVTVMDLTTGYATFANGGKQAKPYAVLEIRRPNGELLYSREKNAPKQKQVFAEEQVADLNFMLNRVAEAGTGRRSLLGFTPQAGKTGTTQSYRDAWFVGYTAHYVTGVWFGNDNFSEMNRVTGGSLPAMTWKQYMLEAEQSLTAAGLLGVPLNGSYTKVASRRDGLVEIPRIPTEAGGFRPSNTANPNGDVVIFRPTRKKKRQGAVVSVLQGMFSLFDGSPQTRTRSRTKGRRIFVSGNKRANKRKRRAARNAKRMRDLLESR
jgi:penicillin-binding protein 1A